MLLECAYHEYHQQLYNEIFQSSEPMRNTQKIINLPQQLPLMLLSTLVVSMQLSQQVQDILGRFREQV
jgi:hypothetical protein